MTLLANRGAVDDDPVVFAMQDRTSWLTGLGILAAFTRVIDIHEDMFFCPFVRRYGNRRDSRAFPLQAKGSRCTCLGMGKARIQDWLKARIHGAGYPCMEVTHAFAKVYGGPNKSVQVICDKGKHCYAISEETVKVIRFGPPR